jgi:hypothetical protein
MSKLEIDGPRACTKAELPEVIALVDSALGRAGTGQTLLTDYPLVYEDENLENVRILRVNGELASVVPFIPWPVVMDGCRFTVCIISPTATAVPHRKKGYGLRCLDDCIERMEAMGCEISILRTKVETFPFYGSGDYQGVRNQAWVYRCTREDAKLFADHGEELALYDPATRRHLDAIQAMHDREKTGVRRSASRYPGLFSLPKMKTLLALRDRLPVAYLLVSRAVNMPGLVEAGGDEAAVETLVHRALAELGEADAQNAHANLTESVLGNLLERKLPGRRQPTSENRMVRINRPSAFLFEIAREVERRNQGVEKTFSLTVGGETIGFEFTKSGLKLGKTKLDLHFELSRRELVSAVFGAHPSYPADAAVGLGGSLAYYFPICLLDRS